MYRYRYMYMYMYMYTSLPAWAQRRPPAPLLFGSARLNQ